MGLLFWILPNCIKTADTKTKPAEQLVEVKYLKRFSEAL